MMLKDVLKCVIIISGDKSVIVHGVHLMLM